MLTNNYYSLLTAGCYLGNEKLTKDIGFIGVDGTTINSITLGTNDSNTSYIKSISFSNIDKPMSHQTKAVSNTSEGILFGAGTIQPTPDDYNINEYLDMSKLTILASKNISSRNRNITVTYTIVNNSEEPITITEYGVFAHIIISGANACIMTAHSLLDIPMTIQPNDSGIVIISLTTG